jgi:hypothetical protein
LGHSPREAADLPVRDVGQAGDLQRRGDRAAGRIDAPKNERRPAGDGELRADRRGVGGGAAALLSFSAFRTAC